MLGPSPRRYSAPSFESLLNTFAACLTVACSNPTTVPSPPADTVPDTGVSLDPSTQETASSAADASPSDDNSSGPEPIQPEAWDAPIRGPLAVDESPDPDVFETHLEAFVKDIELIPGTTTPVWTYNGNISGPEFRVKRGDRVIVHFTNNLPEPTTIHWHGLRIPNAMDGVPGSSQAEVATGETFTYDFVVPDAGTYWYHPHVNTTTQAGSGLYGAFVVTDPDEPADLGDELTLVVSDISLNEDGSFMDPSLSGDLGTLFGREGNVLLVNGKVNPMIDVRAGRRERWRVINAARSRYFQLGLAGHSFTRIGSDGGQLEHPEEIATVVVAPGERADVVLEPTGTTGTELPVRWIPYDRGFGSVFAREEETVFRLRISEQPAYVEAPLPELGREIAPIEITNARFVTMELTHNDSVDGEFALGINGVPSWEAEPLDATIGDVQVWEVKNTFEFAHPFHLHGFFFQVLEANGVVPAVKEWKDTVNVPVDGTVRLAVHFDERPGMWMFHCHILDHADAGMMGMVHLHEPMHHHEPSDMDAGMSSSSGDFDMTDISTATLDTDTAPTADTATFADATTLDTASVADTAAGDSPTDLDAAAVTLASDAN